MNFFQAKPNRLHAGLPIALPAEEAAKACNQAKHFIQRWLSRLFDTGQQIGAAYFIRVEEQVSVQVRASASEPHQMRYAPSDDHEQCQSALKAFYRRQLERFNATGVLQDVEQRL